MRSFPHAPWIVGVVSILIAWLVPAQITAQTNVYPDGGSTTIPANQGPQVVSFTLYSGQFTSLTYSLEWVCTGAVWNCSRAQGSSVTFTYSTTVDLTVSSLTGPGTGQMILRAFGPSGNDTGYYNVTVAIYGVTVTPDNATVTTGPPNTGGHSESFTIQNTGTASNTYTLTCSATAPVTCVGLSATSVTLAAGARTDVAAAYSVSAAGTGTLTLTANGTYATDGGSYSVAVAAPSASFTPSSVTNGAFTQDLRYLVQEVAYSYDGWGRILQLADARGKVTNYLYGGNPNNAFLTKVTRVHDASGPADLVTDIAYDTLGFVSSIKDEGGAFRYFYYDLYGRLDSLRNNSGTKVKAYGYTYSRTSGNSWTFQPASPNAVVDTTFLQQTPMVSVVSTQYLDGLGRPIETVVQDGATYHVAATQYDLMGRLWRAWKPYPWTAAGYDPNFITNATTYYNTYHSTSVAKPYVETQYMADALGRVTRVTPEYIGTAPTAFVLTGYDVDAALKQLVTEVTDESGKKSRHLMDVFGNGVKTILGYSAPEATTTLLTYDVLGQRTQVIDPRSLNTTYSLDTRGLLSSKTSPDAGTVSYKYDRVGNPRFNQDANQAALGQAFFTTYDFANRALVSGQGVASFGTLDPDATSTLESTQGNWLVVRAYGAKPSTAAFPWSLFSTQIAALTLTNVTGRLAAVASLSNGSWQVTLLSYDGDGQVANRYTYTHGNGGTTVLTALNTTGTYLRDLRGALTQRQLTVGSNSFYQWYDYDNRGLLWKTYASTTPTKPAAPDVTDTYLPTGQPQNYQFQGGPLVPIRYTIRGQTEKVGDPALTTYPFSARYAYLPNGVVDTAEFYSDGSPAAQKRYRYAFGPSAYDAINRLRSADFSSWSGSAWTATLAYDLAGITYDGAGNLTALQRYRETGTLIDNLTYSYSTSSNRLSAVTDAISGNAETWDARSGNFTYDANGNVLTAPAPYSLTAATYDPANLPLSVNRSGITTTYRYDDAGERITKQVGTGNAEYNVREGPLTLGAFTVDGTGTPVSSYFNIVWENRVVGRHVSTGTRTYYHMDILGSTRAVALSTTGAVVESYDFEPWGLLMPGRALTGPTKEGFSGKEQDAETGLDYFGARYYMPALGRWAAVDPSSGDMPQWSPYNYVYDDPARQTDPDGRQVPQIYRVQALIPAVDNSAPVQFVNGMAEGFGARAEAATDVRGMLQGVGTILAAGAGDPVAQWQISAGMAAAAQSVSETWSSGPEGKGKVIGGGVFELAFGAVTSFAAGEVVNAVREVRSASEVTQVARLVPDAAESAPRAINAVRRPSAATRSMADAAATDAQGKLRCQYCGRELTPQSGQANSREFDHVVPHARGGGRGIDNIKDACRTCNRAKGARTPGEWESKGH